MPQAAYTNEPPVQGKGGCGIAEPMQLASIGKGVSITPVPTISASRAHKLAAWERDLQIMALSEFGVPLVNLGRVSGYDDCRNLYGRTAGRLSQHAKGLALDVPVFRLADGRAIEVKEHWRVQSAEGRFLRAAHKSACRWFRTVLGAC